MWQAWLFVRIQMPLKGIQYVMQQMKAELCTCTRDNIRSWTQSPPSCAEGECALRDVGGSSLGANHGPKHDTHSGSLKRPRLTILPTWSSSTTTSFKLCTSNNMFNIQSASPPSNSTPTHSIFVSCHFSTTVCFPLPPHTVVGAGHV